MGYEIFLGAYLKIYSLDFFNYRKKVYEKQLPLKRSYFLGINNAL